MSRHADIDVSAREATKKAGKLTVWDLRRFGKGPCSNTQQSDELVAFTHQQLDA